jgi:hypothetical protein
MPELTVTLSIKIKVEAKEDIDYYLEPDGTTATPSFIADMMDEMEDSFAGEVLSINGMTPAVAQKKLQDGLV